MPTQPVQRGPERGRGEERALERTRKGRGVEERNMWNLGCWGSKHTGVPHQHCRNYRPYAVVVVGGGGGWMGRRVISCTGSRQFVRVHRCPELFASEHASPISRVHARTV